MSILQLHYASLEQRVASVFYNGLAKSVWQDKSQRDLQAFFSVLYQNLYENPELFGFQLQPDEYLIEGEEGEKDHKQVLNRKMKKSRSVILKMLEFLIYMGINGTIEGSLLKIQKDDYLASVFRSRNQKKFVAGMADLGFLIEDSDEQVVFQSETSPDMMPALQALAQACVNHSDQRIGQFNFWRCDFNVLTAPDYVPSAEELYTLFMPEDTRRLLELHTYFVEQGYQSEMVIYDTSWDIKYQGDRKVKSTPLYQVTYEDRYLNPMRVYLKPASTNRLAPILTDQPDKLQADFFNRTYPCQEEKCGWCATKKGLGPSIIEYQGEQRKVCWYSNPMIYPFVDESIELVKQYERMHQALAA